MEARKIWQCNQDVQLTKRFRIEGPNSLRGKYTNNESKMYCIISRKFVSRKKYKLFAMESYQKKLIHPIFQIPHIKQGYGKQIKSRNVCRLLS